MKIIEEVELKKLSKNAVAAKFGIPLSTLSTIVTNSGKIQEKVESSVSLKRKNLRSAKFTEVEDELYTFFCKCREEKLPISGLILQEKAEYIALRKKIDNFRCSIGWLTT